jgi:hypothetical protein
MAIQIQRVIKFHPSILVLSKGASSDYCPLNSPLRSYVNCL